MIKVNLLKDTANVGSQPGPGTFATFGGPADDSGQPDQKDILVKLFVLILPLVVAYFALDFVGGEKQKSLNQIRARLSELEGKKAQLGPEIEAVKNFQKEKDRLQVQIDTIKMLSRERLRNVKALEAIQNLIPERAWLTELKLIDGKVAMVGQAVDDQTIAQFMALLEENVFFANVRLGKTAETNRPGEGIVKVFEIETQVEGM